MHKVFKTLMAALDKAIDKGYTVAWGGDVSGNFYRREGLAFLQESGPYEGIWYMSRDYMVLNTTYIYLNREALDRGILK